MYRRILVPLECSWIDDKVLDHVQPLASALGAEVVLLRVARDGLETHEAETPQVCLGRAAALLEDAGVAVRTVLAHGRAADRVVEQAVMLNCDLIVLASQPVGRLGRLLSGSLADDVRQRSNVPVLLLKPRRG